VAAAALGGVLAGLAGTGAYAAATAGSVHTGSIPSVGPASAVTTGGGPGGGGPGGVPPTGVSSGSRPAPPTGNAPGSAQSSGAQPAAGGAGGGIEASANSALTAKLQATTTSTTTWAAATVGDMSAANLQLASGKAVMAIGGWSGSDNAPTLTQFLRYVANGRIHYFVAGQGGGGGQGGGTASQITSWVQAHYTVSTVGGQTVYDLTVATTS
jgi:hypothetical protein